MHISSLTFFSTFSIFMLTLVSASIGDIKNANDQSTVESITTSASSTTPNGNSTSTPAITTTSKTSSQRRLDIKNISNITKNTISAQLLIYKESGLTARVNNYLKKIEEYTSKYCDSVRGDQENFIIQAQILKSLADEKIKTADEHKNSAVEKLKNANEELNELEKKLVTDKDIAITNDKFNKLKEHIERVEQNMKDFENALTQIKKKLEKTDKLFKDVIVQPEMIILKENLLTINRFISEEQKTVDRIDNYVNEIDGYIQEYNESKTANEKNSSKYQAEVIIKLLAEEFQKEQNGTAYLKLQNAPVILKNLKKMVNTDDQSINVKKELNKLESDMNEEQKKFSDLDEIVDKLMMKLLTTLDKFSKHIDSPSETFYNLRQLFYCNQSNPPAVLPTTSAPVDDVTSVSNSTLI